MTNRFASARKFASNIIESHNLTPPIDPVEIIEAYGIELVVSDNQLSVEAFSELGDIPKITINRELDFPARKKFTLAHELGHVIIPWHNGDTKCNTDNPYTLIGGKQLLDTQELEANIFASELLMPHKWLVEELSHSSSSFQETLQQIQNSAKTSAMACLYALEHALPAGKLFYVKSEYTEYWKKFTSERTCTAEFYGKFSDRIKYLSQICNSYEHFHFSQYEIIYFDLVPCPEVSEIKQVYSRCRNIGECVNILSRNHPSKILLCINEIVNAIGDVYSCFVFENGTHIRTFKHPSSNVKNYCSDYSGLIHILEYNNLDYCVVVDNTFEIVFVKNCDFHMPTVETTEPNALLRHVIQEIYPENQTNMIHRINGIVSNASNRLNDAEQIYERIRARFSTAEDFVDFYNHPCFNTYVVNKIRTILYSRTK